MKFSKICLNSIVNIPIYLKMKRFNQENLNQQSERITFLLAELNSTLDLYDEKSIDTEIDSNET